MQAGEAGELSDSHTVGGEGDHCTREEASVEEGRASRGAAWGLGDPWATRNEVLGVAYPWVGVQGVACQVGAEGEAGLRSPVVLGDAGPSQVAHGALA